MIDQRISDQQSSIVLNNKTSDLVSLSSQKLNQDEQPLSFAVFLEAQQNKQKTMETKQGIALGSGDKTIFPCMKPRRIIKRSALRKESGNLQNKYSESNNFSPKTSKWNVHADMMKQLTKYDIKKAGGIS